MSLGSHITTVLTTQSLYLLAFGPVFLVCLLCALRGDGTGATSASWFAILSPIHLYELFACLLLRVHMRNLADPLVIHAMYRDQQYRAMVSPTRSLPPLAALWIRLIALFVHYVSSQLSRSCARVTAMCA